MYNQCPSRKKEVNSPLTTVLKLPVDVRLVMGPTGVTQLCVPTLKGTEAGAAAAELHTCRLCCLEGRRTATGAALLLESLDWDTLVESDGEALCANMV